MQYVLELKEYLLMLKIKFMLQNKDLYFNNFLNQMPALLSDIIVRICMKTKHDKKY